MHMLLSPDDLRHRVSQDGWEVNDLAVTTAGEAKQSDSLHSEAVVEVKSEAGRC